MRKKLLQYFLFCFLGLTFLIPLHSQRVSFDSTFGVNARSYTQIGNPGGFSSVYKFTTVRPDGSFYMAGEYNQPDTNFFVTKFKTTGSIDSSYGVNGRLYIRMADFGVSSILSSGIDSSSRFFFVGRTGSPSGPNFFRLKVIRHTANAKVDSGFGINGIADIPFDNLVLAGINYPVAAYRDGRLLISCLLYEGINASCGLVRLKSNGTLDSTFAVNGKLFLPPSSGLTTFYTLDIQQDEKIVFTRQFSSLLRLFRYNTNGTIDNSFNQNGMISIDFPATFNAVHGIRILSDSKILLSAGSIAGNYLYRFKSNGQRDSTFGGIGYVLYNYGFKTYARDFAEQPDGKILAAGVIQDNQQPIPNINTLITRTNINGSIDSTFDDDGVWFFNYAGNPSSGMKNLNLLSTGKMLFSGLESGADWTHFTIYRLKEAYQLTSLAWGNAASTIISYDCSSQVRLNWSTLTEVNINYFKIQHSTDNVQFNTLAQVPATGNSAVQMSYQYLHTVPANGNNYYQIIAVAANGQEFLYGTLTAVILPAPAPLFQWLSHEVVKKAGEECLPSIKLYFRTQRPVIADSILIEHSKDSLNFIVIGKIGISNPQAQFTNYEFTHTNPVFGKNYYRLRTNGTVSSCSSSVYAVLLKEVKDIIAFPVPASEKLFFNQQLPAGSQLAVFDMKGSLVMRKELTSPVNELFISHLAAGQYIMRLYIFCNQKTIKFLKVTQ